MINRISPKWNVWDFTREAIITWILLGSTIIACISIAQIFEYVGLNSDVSLYTSWIFCVVTAAVIHVLFALNGYSYITVRIGLRQGPKYAMSALGIRFIKAAYIILPNPYVIRLYAFISNAYRAALLGYSHNLASLTRLEFSRIIAGLNATYATITRKELGMQSTVENLQQAVSMVRDMITSFDVLLRELVTIKERPFQISNNPDARDIEHYDRQTILLRDILSSLHEIHSSMVLVRLSLLRIRPLISFLHYGHPQLRKLETFRDRLEQLQRDIEKAKEEANRSEEIIVRLKMQQTAPI